MNGIQTQLSMAMMLVLAIQGWLKKAGCSQPRIARRAARGPNRFSMIDLPTIQLTATELSMKGSRNATRKNFRARMSAFRSSARPNAIAYCTITVAT